MKKFMALFLTGMMAMGTYGTAFAAETKIAVDGVPVVFTDAKPFVDENGRTMVPLRPIADAMGLQVAWIAEKQMAIFAGEMPLEFIFANSFETEAEAAEAREVIDHVMQTVYFTIGKERLSGTVDVFLKNDELVSEQEEDVMDTAPVVKDGRTYAPVRYLAEAFAYDVGWDGTTSTVTITDNR